MEIFYINLDKDVARRESMERQLSELGLSYTRISGVYGKDLNEEEIRKCYSRRRALYRQSRDLSRAEIGCAMSQLEIYLEILRRQLPYALILEDDVILTKKVVEALPDIEALIRPERPELLLLSPSQVCCKNANTVRSCGIYQAAPFKSGYFASSYVVTNLAAQSLLKELDPVGDVADCWKRLHRFKVVDIFGLKPHLIEQDQEMFGSSTNADFSPFPNFGAKMIYKLRRLRCILLDAVSASWRRRFHPYNDVLK